MSRICQNRANNAFLDPKSALFGKKRGAILNITTMKLKMLSLHIYTKSSGEYESALKYACHSTRYLVIVSRIFSQSS